MQTHQELETEPACLKALQPECDTHLIDAHNKVRLERVVSDCNHESFIALTKRKGMMTFSEEPEDLHRWTDEELIVAAQDGTTSALEELLTRHRSLVYGAVRRLTGNAEEADDVVQETMLRAFVSIGKFRREARFSSWLFAIAINASISMKRKSGRAQWVYLDDKKASCDQGSAWVLSDSRPTPEQECLRQEHSDLLRREVLKLHPQHRFILRACDLGESSIEEIARALGITHGAAKSRLHRARRMLSRAFRRHTATRIHGNTGPCAVSSDL
jgi:RNA polymerase sigma-70 factor (ECF subfamily)